MDKAVHWYENYRTWIIILSIATSIFAGLIAWLQFLETERQTRDDDKRDNQVKQYLQKNQELSENLAEKQTKLNELSSRNEKLTSTLNEFVTGGDNIPVFLYNADIQSISKKGGRNGDHLVIQVSLYNKSKSIPLRNVSIEFIDVFRSVVLVERSENEVGSKTIDVQNLSDDEDHIYREFASIAPGDARRVYDIKIPNILPGQFVFKFRISWETSYYILLTTFKRLIDKDSTMQIKMDFEASNDNVLLPDQRKYVNKNLGEIDQ